MAAALPFVLSGLGGASAIGGALEARKTRKEQLQQSERIAAETRANTPQGERMAEGLFTKRRARRTPGFSDAGAASTGGTAGAYALGQ